MNKLIDDESRDLENIALLRKRRNLVNELNEAKIRYDEISKQLKDTERELFGWTL
jgi:hypothetical protein